MARAGRSWVLAWLVLLLVAVDLGIDGSEKESNGMLLVWLSGRTGGSLTFEWAVAPAWEQIHSIDDIEGFSVYVGDSEVAKTDNASRKCTVFGLAANTEYGVQIAAQMAAGANATNAPVSDAVLARTTTVSSPGKPAMPRLIAYTGGTIEVAADTPEETGGANLTTITVVVRNVDDQIVVTKTQSSKFPAVVVNRLDAQTYYSITSFVTNEAGLSSVEGSKLSVQTGKLDLPGPCPPPTIISTTGGSVRLQLNPPVDDGGARISSYVLFMAANGSDSYEEVTSFPVGSAIDTVDVLTLPGYSDSTPLYPNTEYRFKALAVNLADICTALSSSVALAESASARTLEASVPDAPLAPYFISATGGQIMMYLIQPQDMNGSSLIGFSVTVDDIATSFVAATSNVLYRLSFLAANTSYSVRVAAVTDLGSTLLSDKVIMKTSSVTPPSSPRDVVVSELSASGGRVQWSIPLDSGGSNIAGYTVSVTSSAKTYQIYTVSRYLLLKTLTARTVYTVKVVAINDFGYKSAASGARGVSFETLPMVAPSSPWNVSALSRSGGTIEVAWNPPIETGGAALTELQYNTSIFSVISCGAESTSRTCGSCNAVSLGDGYAFLYSDKACSLSSECPDGSSTCCVSNNNISTLADNLCALAIQTPRYQVSKGTNSTVFYNLNHSSVYYFGVRAVNSVGRSPYSTVTALQTGPPSKPSFPLKLVQSNSSGGSIQLSWEPPLDRGGSIIIGYRVYRDLERLIDLTQTTHFTDCGNLTSSTRYKYSVTAINASRDEGNMAFIAASTTTLTPPLTPSIDVVERTGNLLRLRLSPACDNGGVVSGLIYQYKVTHDATTVAMSSFDCCTFVVRDLAPNQLYNVQVRSMNGVGASSWAMKQISTSSGVPSPPSILVEMVNTYSVMLRFDSFDQEVVSFILFFCAASGQWHSISFTCDIGDVHSCPPTYRIDSLLANSTYQVYVQATGVAGSTNSSTLMFSTLNEPNGLFQFESSFYSTSIGGSILITVVRVGGSGGDATVDLQFDSLIAVAMSCSCENSVGCSCTITSDITGVSTASQLWQMQFVDGQAAQNISVKVEDNAWNISQPFTSTLRLVGNSASAQANTMLRIELSQSTGMVGFTGSTSKVLENDSYAVVDLVRLAGMAGPTLVKIETFDITAHAGEDYVELSGDVAFADQQTNTSIWIKLINDAGYRGDRSFGVRIINQSGYANQSLATHEVVIIDDDDVQRAIPNVPVLPVLIQATGGEIELSCGGSVSSSSSHEGFVVRIAPFTGSAFYSFYNMSDSTFVLSGLSSRTTLRIALAAWNAYGVSAYSSEIIVSTTEPTWPSSPRSLRVSAVTGTAAMLEWNPPRDDGGSSISGYDIKVFDSESDLIRSYRVSSLHVLVTDLSVTTEYVAYVSAASTAFSTPNFERSNCSLTILTTNGTIPSQPPAVKLVNRSQSGGSLLLEFQSPKDNGGWPITGYSLFLRQRDSLAPIEVASGYQDSFWEGCATLCVLPASMCTCTVYKLIVNTEYEVYAVAYNAQGASLEGNLTIVSTSEEVTLPSPPVNFQASVVTSGNILLSWDPPLDLGGASDVIGYMVYQAYNNSVNSSVFNVYDGQDSPRRSVLLRGLQRNSEYEFEIVALNSASYCVSTEDRLKSPRIVVSTLAYSELTPPQSLTVVSATGGAIEIAWSPPDDLAGVPLYGYYVSLVEKERNQSAFLTNYMLSDGTLSFTHYQLKEETKYCYTVTAWNQDGPSDPSEILCSSTMSVSAPSAVWNLISTGSTGGQINISWESPRDTGGRDIVYYEVVRTELWGSMSTRSTIVTETILIDSTGLRSESGYLYRIIPFNSVYQGQASYLSVWTGLPTLPRAPVVTDVIPFGGKIEVHWQPDGDTGGLDLISYTIILWSDDMVSKIEERTLNKTSATFGNLLARTQYRLMLSSSNAVGASPSVENLVVTESPDVPGIPPPPEAPNILGGSLLISVAFPEYRGGVDVTLVLYKGPDVVYIFPADETNVTIYGLLANTQYIFRVGARNIEGETLSTELQVVTGAISTPSQVQNVVVTAESFDSLELTWDAVQDSGGDSSMFYNVTYFRCGSDQSPLEAPMTLVVISDTSATISSLAYSSRYCIRVVAVTGTFLAGPASSTVAAWTEDPLQGVAIAEQGKIFVKEDSGYAVVSVKRVNGSYGNMSFSFFTTSNTAFEMTNFVGSNGTMEMFSRINEAFVTIQVLNDATYNPNISFLVTVVDDLTLVSSSTTVTILDDGDAGFLSFASARVDYLENSGIIQLGITRTRAWSPLVVIEPFLSGNRSVLDRFHLLETNLTFDEGVTDLALTIQVVDDSQYQLVPDSINVSFRIVHGGALYGLHPIVNITADDDGDVSLPHNCTSLRKVGATGGSIALQWSAPIDRGGANVVLSYIVEGYYRGTAVVTANSDSESMSLYGLNASTAYDFAVRAANSAGEGNRIFLRLVSTTAASLPTVPQCVQLLSASSSSLLISWLPPVDTGGTNLVGYKIYNVSASGSLTLFESVSCTSPTQCTIKGLVAITPYTIQVRAITAFSTNGPLSPSIVFFTSNPDLPDAPPIPSVPWISAGAMTITMEDPLNVGGSDIQEYRVYIKMDGSSAFDLVYSGSKRNCTIYRLNVQTVYSIKFQAVNIVGPSDYSPTLNKTTLERSLPSAPTDLRLISATGGALNLAWNEPLDIGGRDITGYVVTITSINGTNITQLGYDGRGDATQGGTVFGLNATTSYLMYVIAFTDVSNCFGESQRVRSAVLGVNTSQPTVPGSPTNFLAVSKTGGLIELAWLPPGDTGGIQLTGITVYAVAPTGGLLTIYASNNTKITSFKHTGLTEATSYSYLVVASNKVGDSPPSATLALSTTPATPPSPPLNVTQLSYRTGGAIQICWSPPIDSGGQPVLSYWVYRNGILIAQDIPAHIRNYTDKGNLIADTMYSYSVRVYSQSGLGSDLSDNCQARTSLATAPMPPQLTASKVGSSNISVSWVDDSDTGGLNVARYNLLLLRNSVTINAFSGGGNSYTFVGLNASSSYTINISSISAAGSSQSISATFLTLAGTVPGSPNAPLAVSIYGGNFTVQITPPVDNGGTPILTMKLFEQTRGFLATLNVGPSSLLQYSFVGATSMTNYAVWCSATNAIGEGQASLATVIRTGPMSRPGAIAKPPQVVVSSGTSLSLVWQAPKDFGGGGFLSYDLRVLASNYTVVMLTTLATEAVVSGLRFNTVYNISVRSTNDVGAGDWSPSLSTSTQPDAAGQLNFVAPTASVPENASFISLSVRRSNGLSGKITLTYAVQNTGSATIGKDFALIPGSSISRGTLDIMDQQNQSSIVVYILNDAIYESPDESFVIQLITVTGTAILGANTQMTVTILDDGDAGYVSFDRALISVPEDAQVVVVPIIRERGSSGRVILQFSYNDITATVDRDYRKLMNNVVMEDGVTRSELRVAIINDRVFEFPDEIFQIRMMVAAGGAAVNRSSANITILDDGDVSVPAACPTPQILATTGGLVNLLLRLPQHNGSASGKLSNYVIRLEWQNGALELRPAVNLSVQIGQLNASTTYNVAVAANNSVGVGFFSDRLVFTTTLPTLPGLIASVRNTTATGGSMSLSWGPPFDTGGVNITKYRLYIVSSQGTPQLAAENFDGATSTTVYGLSASTSYKFMVQAGNNVRVPELADGWGAISNVFIFSTDSPTLPGPTPINAGNYRMPTGGAVTLSWNAPLDNGGVPISSYSVYAKTATRGFSPTETELNLPLLYGTTKLLNASASYLCFVLARNQVNPTLLSGNLSVTAGSSFIQTTSDLSKVLRFGAVLAIQSAIVVVGNISKASPTMIPLMFQHVGSTVPASSGSLIGWATSFTTLNTTAATLPRPPLPPTLSVATGGALSFTFESPLDTGGIPILSFKVYIDGKEPPSSSINNTGVAVSYLQLRALVLIGNLSPLTSYTITGVAVNALSQCFFGREATSKEIVFTTGEISKPSQPQVVASDRTGGGIRLTIIDPLDTGGVPIQYYKIYYRVQTARSMWILGYNGSDHRATLAGLRSLTTYEIMATVSNSMFESDNSSVISPKTTGVSAPGACAPVVLVSATGGALNVSWSYPQDNGGSPVLSFLVSIASGEDGSGKKFYPTTNLSYTFYGLSADSSYDVVVRAQNAFGKGAESTPVRLQTTAMTSPSGNIKIVAEKVTGGAVVISFNEPEDLGGARSGDIIYQVFVDRDNVANLSYSPSSILPTSSRRLGQTIARRLETTSTGVVNGLDPSSLYNIQIRPINAAASGTISSGLSTMTSTATPPSIPNNVKGDAMSGGSISLQWNPPDDMGGLPILHYTVIGAGNGLNLTAEVTGGLTSTVVYDLLPATEYTFEVYASNEVGDSPSVKVSVRTTSITSPSSPRDVIITSVTFDQVSCEWIPPVDNGGDPVISYVVIASPLTTLGSILTTITTSTQAIISGLQASAQYGISVVATNSMGMTSVKSMAKYATIASSASTPSMFHLQCASRSSATLKWYAYAGASEYRILRNGSKLADVGITTSFTDEYPDLIDQHFEYSVQVLVGGTWGPESDPVSVTPDLFSLSKANTFCLGSSGQIAIDNYTDNVVSDWHIAPDTPYSRIVLMFERFDLECDHDFIEILDAESLSRLWKGGCYREGLFVYQTDGPVIVRFSSDQDVSGGSFSVIYATDSSFTESAIPAPGGYYSRCSKHGQPKANGKCKCNVGFTGEDCSNRIVCCSDSTRCSHPVCDIDPANVIVVDTNAGEDSRSGAMMDASEAGTASKAVRTLSKALSISRENSYIFIYPGTYSGSMNRKLNIAGANLTIQTLKGSYWTTIDCSDASQALHIDSSALVIGGITFRNCSSRDGGTIKILSSELHAEDVAILGSSAEWRGGSITTQDSTVHLSKSYISQSTSGEYGGGIHAINSTLILDKANVTWSSSTDGGAIALIGSCVLIGIESASLKNNEAENSGGAILVDTMGSDQESIRGVLVDSNSASIGGGIVINPDSSLELKDVVISNNYAKYQGGGIAMSNGSSLQTQDVSIQLNRASREGGGIYGRTMVEIRDSQVGDKGTVLINNTAYAGGGIYLMQADAKIDGMVIEGGSAFSYGGGLAAMRSSVTLSSLTLQFNNATSGGAIAGVDTTFISEGDVAILQNTATNGGGLSLDASSLLGNKSVCNQNSASDAGGCIFVNGDTFLEALYADSNVAARGGSVATSGSRSKLIFKDIDVVGSIAYRSGGGIWIENAFLNISDSRVRSSEALLGGGVYSAFSTIVGTFVIDNCRAENDGGGLYLTGASSLVYAHVSNSMAHRGGALFITKASITLENVVMTSSTAFQDGGGLYSIDSSLWLTNITASNHTSLVSGGGMFLMDSAVVHNNVTIASGQSRNGGGVYMIESTFEGSNFDYETTVISQNSASESGGNVYIHSPQNGSMLADTEIKKGRADVDGGGLKIFDGYVIIRNCQVTENVAPTGGGLSIVGGSECRMTNVDISINNASQQGGGMSLDNSTLLHDTVQLSYNSAPLGGGIFSAGVVVVDFGTPSVGVNNISRLLMLIESNTATSTTEQSGYGGSLYVSAKSYTTARGLDVYRSQADNAGGGIYVETSKLRLSNSKISQCNSSDGGALYIKDRSRVDVSSTLLAQNYASGSGGAISATSSEHSDYNEIQVFFSTFESNVADINGGAIYLENTNMDGTHNVFTNNTANQGSGGAIASLGISTINVFGWEFHNNTVGDVNGQFGGTIYINEGVESSISDSVILSNSEATLVRYGGLIYVQGPSSSLSIIGSRLGLGQAYYGGAIYAVDASVLIQNTTIEMGFAFEFGGGIYAQNADLRVTDSSIVNNFAYYSGGAIFMKAGGHLEMLNSVIDLNGVQDSGGAIYLASGAEISSEITDTALTRTHSNYGYGSVIYVGRKNEIVLTRCTVSYNGGQNTEAGALYLIDGIGTIRYSVFEHNSAVSGAAIAIARDGKLILADSTLKNNSATSAGGALYGSVRAVASVLNTNLEQNSAIEGGAVFATGSSNFEFRGVRATHNLARSFGGAFSFRGMASLKVTASQIHFNGAYTGGGISLDENTSSVITTSDFGSNSATDFGGAIYINRQSKVSTKSPMTCMSLQFDTNDAAAGSDIFWVFHPWFVLNCDNCHSYTGENANIATSATTITAGWWPEAVTSGVKLSANKIHTNSTLINGRRLGDSSSQKAERTNAENSNPALDTLWPTMVVRDYYGMIASQDNQTACIAHVSNDENDTFSFVPSGWVAVSNGYITFENAEILSISRTKPYTLNVECSLSSDVDSGLSINITVERCLAGYENVDGLCLSCEKGKYSLDGWKCYLCPLGATCEMTDEDGVTVGVGVPTREEGYYLSESRETLLKSSCVNPSLWAAEDPCKGVVGDSLSERIYRCSSLEGFESYWNRKRIFACISGMEYYGCDTYDACIKDNSTLVASQLSTSSLSSSFNVADQCDLGYVGIMCATCDDEYYRVSNGSCRPCKDPKDPAVARMTRLLTVIPIAYALFGIAVVCYFFYDGSEKDILKYARAAKKFQLYGPDSERNSIIRSVQLYTQERVSRMIQTMRASIPTRRQRVWLFGIAPVALPTPGFRAEKFKILLGFFQVFGGFKRTYEIPWPDDMSRLLDVYSIVDFNFIDTTSVECFYRRNYFASYRLSLFAVVVLLMVTLFLLVWGSVRYRVVLSTLPRHCVKCGLPVFQMLHRVPQTLVKRATKVSMLKMQQKMHLSDSFTKQSLGTRMKANLSSRAEDAFNNAKHWVSRTSFGQSVMRIALKTRLPASSSEHQASCPTSHRISNDVQAMVVRSNIRLWRARIRLRLNYKTYQNRCIKLLFWILLLFYPDLSARVIGIFYCEEIGPYYYLTRDRRFRCYEGEWLAYLPLSIVLILFWVIGVPLFFWLILFIKRRHGVADTLVLLEDPSNIERKELLLVEVRRDLIDRGKKVDEDTIQLFESEMLAEYLRNRKLQEPTVIAQVGFIYHAYDARFWWFEVWDLGRKLFLNCVVGLLASSAANRMISGLVVLLVYLSVMLFFQPYKFQSDSALAGITQIQLFITLFCGLILKLGSHTLEDSVILLLTYTAFATNVCTIAYAVLSIIHERYLSLRQVQRQVRENHRRAIQLHVRKLWRRAYGYAFTEVYLRDLSIRPMPVHVFLEIARRDRAARMNAELEEQLEKTVPHLERSPQKPHSESTVERAGDELQQSS